MNANGWNAIGLEPDGGARNMAKQLYGVELKDTKSFYELIPSSFNAITLWHVLEHVHDVHACVQQLRELLADSGVLFVAVPNYTSLDASIYKQYWAAYDVPRHLYHFSPRAIKTLMEKHGLFVAHHEPMWYDSFYISLLSSKYKKGKANWFAAVWNGFRSNIVAASNIRKCSSLIYVIKKQ